MYYISQFTMHPSIIEVYRGTRTITQLVKIKYNTSMSYYHNSPEGKLVLPFFPVNITTCIDSVYAV